jgi:hypothetical protein
VKIQTKQFNREQPDLSPVLAPLPPSQSSYSASRKETPDVFNLWHGKDALVPTFSNQNLPVPIHNDAKRRRAKAREISNIDIDVRNMSAREMANLSTEFYMQRLISWEEYDALAFQSELHPDYNKTVGALLEKQAEPDSPRDFVREWEKKLAFVRRYNRNDVHTIKIAERITRLLRQLAGVLAYE